MTHFCDQPLPHESATPLPPPIQLQPLSPPKPKGEVVVEECSCEVCECGGGQQLCEVFPFISQVFKNLSTTIFEHPKVWKHGFKKKPLDNFLWTVCIKRHEEGSLHVEKFDHVDLTAETPIDSNEAASSAIDIDPAAGSSTDPLALPSEAVQQKQQEEVVDNMMRIAEETKCRQIMIDLDWATVVPIVDAEQHQNDQRKLEGLVRLYLDDFDQEATRQVNLETMCTNWRLLLAETTWSFDALQKAGGVPRNLFHPRDKHIRSSAQAAEGFSDPGNPLLDIVVHLLRLWKYCSSQQYEQVLAVPGVPYGENGNKSSKGPCNLRGNIVEALTLDLQERACRVDKRPWRGRGESTSVIPPWRRQRWSSSHWSA